MSVAVSDYCTSDFELFTMLCAMFDGSITVHCAFAFPVPSIRQRRKSGSSHLVLFLFSVIFLDFVVVMVLSYASGECDYHLRHGVIDKENHEYHAHDDFQNLFQAFHFSYYCLLFLSSASLFIAVSISPPRVSARRSTSIFSVSSVV